MGTDLVMVMDFAEGGDLGSYLKERIADKETVGEQRALDLFSQPSKTWCNAPSPLASCIPPSLPPQLGSKEDLLTPGANWI